MGTRPPLTSYPRYRFQHLGVEVHSRPPNELWQWLSEVVESIIELCEAGWLTLTDIEAFQRLAAAEAKTLAVDPTQPAATHGLQVLEASLQSLESARSLRAARGHEREPVIALDAWLEWRRHLDDSRRTCDRSSELWRMELRDGTISPGRPVPSQVMECIELIGKSAVLLRSTRLQDWPVQREAIEKSMLLHCLVLGHAGEVEMVSQFAAAVVHDKKKWAAFLEVLIREEWLYSRSARGYLNAVTSIVYRRDVRPDCDGLDSQGFEHRAGPGGRVKPNDALRPDLQENGVTVEEIASTAPEALVERRFTQRSLAELQAAVQEDADLKAYVRALVRYPTRRRPGVWDLLGWGEQKGMAIDRRFRRLRGHLKDIGAGMEWREAPTPGTSASQFVHFEPLLDGARGRAFGVYQHKPVEPREDKAKPSSALHTKPTYKEKLAHSRPVAIASRSLRYNQESHDLPRAVSR